MTPTDDPRVLAYDPFADDKDSAGVRNQRKRAVTTRKEHECLFTPTERHTMPVGTRAVRYEAIVDGHWRHFYLCTKHIIEWQGERE